jgi:hypothetical protein
MQGPSALSARGEDGHERSITIQGMPPHRKPERPGKGQLPPGGVSGHVQGPEPELVSETRLVEADSRVAGAPLHQLYSDVRRQGRKEKLYEMIRHVVAGGEGVEILTEADTPVLHVTYPDRTVPVEFAGDGVRDLVRMSMEIVAPDGALVLVEEPELHQHPRAIGQGAQAVVAAVQAGIQVVLSTHSLEFIDYVLAVADEQDLDRLSLFRLKLDNGRLISSRLDGKDVAFARKQIEDDLR